MREEACVPGSERSTQQAAACARPRAPPCQTHRLFAGGRGRGECSRGTQQPHRRRSLRGWRPPMRANRACSSERRVESAPCLAQAYESHPGSSARLFDGMVRVHRGASRSVRIKPGTASEKPLNSGRDGQNLQCAHATSAPPAGCPAPTAPASSPCWAACTARPPARPRRAPKKTG